MSCVEQIADDVYVLSDLEPAHSERSWLPADAKGFEPFNKFVIVKPDVVLLLETGVAAHCDSVIATLRDIVGHRKLVLLPTRSELESIGNLGAIIDAFPRVQLLTTTRALPPLGLCHVREDKRDSVPARRIRRGESLDGVGFGNLQTLNPVIRILGTIWIYDRDSRILFSSDFFANDLLESADQPVIRRSAAGLSDPATLRRSIVAKFDWLERAETTALRAQWKSMFRDIQPIALAPSLGRVQYGSDLVQQVIELYYRAVFETGSVEAVSVRGALASEPVNDASAELGPVIGR
jgi:flavorubredoxin